MIEPHRSSARANLYPPTLERSRVAAEGWTPQPARDSVASVAASIDPPVTPLEHLALEPLNSQSASAKLVWLYVVEKGAGEHSLRAIGRNLGLNSGTVHTAIRALEEAGLIESETSSGTTSSLKAKKPRMS